MPKTGIILFENVDSTELHSASLLLRAITHPLRLKMIAFIDKNKLVNVNKIFTTLDIDQSIASQQLNILRSAQLVKTQRDGKYIYYSLNYEKIRQVNDILEKYRVK